MWTLSGTPQKFTAAAVWLVLAILVITSLHAVYRSEPPDVSLLYNEHADTGGLGRQHQDFDERRRPDVDERRRPRLLGRHASNLANHLMGSAAVVDGPCTCDAVPGPHWDPPPHEDAPAECFFFDIGVNTGSSSLAFNGMSAEDACGLCPLARALGDDGNYSGPWKYTKDCIHQTDQSIKLLKADTYPVLHEHGFDPKQCRVVMIEGSSEFDLIVDRLGQMLDNSVPFKSTAAWMCDGRLTFHQRTTLAEREEHFKNTWEVPAVNFIRILHTLVREKDFVVVKMDIEGGEYEILPCLARSPAKTLIDQFYIETHDRFLLDKPDVVRAKNDALSVLQKAGVLISDKWP